MPPRSRALAHSPRGLAPPVLAGVGVVLLGAAADLAFAVAEIVHMTYHLDWTVFLFAHTIAEVLDLMAFILVFVGAVQTSVARASTRAAHA